MKRTESADVMGTGLPLADGEAVSQTAPSPTDQRRRQLVRGVMAAAPLVLTLRSGALAAASCTGTKIVPGFYKTDSQSRIRVTSSNNFVTSGLTGFNDDAAHADYCFKNVNACSDATLAAEGKIETHDLDDQHVAVFRSGTGSSTRYTCGNPADAAFASQQTGFAILSSASATSLINAG